MSCDCVIAYNGYADFVDAEVRISDVKNALSYIKESKKDWIDAGIGRTDMIYQNAIKFYESATDKEFLECSYKTAVYCPECGVKIDWSLFE